MLENSDGDECIVQEPKTMLGVVGSREEGYATHSGNNMVRRIGIWSQKLLQMEGKEEFESM